MLNIYSPRQGKEISNLDIDFSPEPLMLTTFYVMFLAKWETDLF